MRSHKYRRYYPVFLYKNGFDIGRYYREGSRYHKPLNSLYYDSQTWGALHKAWVGYSIDINKGEFDKEIYYAHVIQKLQKKLNLEVAEFKCLEGLDEEDIKLIKESMAK